MTGRPKSAMSWEAKAAIIGAVITAGATVIAAAINHSMSSTSATPPTTAIPTSQPAPTPSVPSPASNTSSNPSLAAPNQIPIKVDRVNGQVAMCTTVSGEGDVPLDKNLWLAVLSNTGKYFFRPVIPNVVQHRWISKKVSIGSKGDPPGTLFAIYAVLVDDATNQQLAQERFAGGIATLPPSFEKVDQIEVERGPDSTECK
jgi:hypothetical protein